MRLRRAAVGALVAGAVLVPATVASAGHHRAAKLPLALVPLQTAQLGAAGKGLALDYGSGPKYISNIGLKAFDVRSYMEDDGYSLADGGQYSLDYGDPFTGSTGVTEIRTAVQRYKTHAAAKKAYRGWRYVDASLRQFNPGGAWQKIKVPAVGAQNFAYLGRWAVPTLNPIVGLDEQVLAGRFVLSLTVFAGSTDAAEHAAPGLARSLYHRLRSMLRGHLTGKPVTLPRKPKAGQASDGPDLTAMVLQPSDVGQAGTPLVQQRYFAFPPADSTYQMTMASAGLYDEGLGQDIFWWPTATEATYAEAYVRAFIGAGSPVDLSAVGDNASGAIFDGGSDGALVVLTLTNGRAGEYIFGSTSGSGPAPTSSDVQTLAQAAANRLDAGLVP